MAALTCAGAAVIAGRVEVPRLGAWTADLRLDTNTVPTGLVELLWDGATVPWRGTVVPGRAGLLETSGPVRALIVGGGGGLSTLGLGAAYRQTSARVVLNQLLTAAGESLAGSSDGAIDQLLARWSRLAGAVGAQVAALATRLGLAWRVLPSGLVWLGRDALTEQPLPDATTVTTRRPTLGSVSINTARVWQLEPGRLFEGVRIESLTHTLAATSLETTLCLP